ncbi:MAG: hypothetical protein QOI63_832 [Thermoplasmata archaeon]|nr:hypothetical protein [Thermoplasmata archaeon]
MDVMDAGVYVSKWEASVRPGAAPPGVTPQAGFALLDGPVLGFLRC